MTCTGKRSRGWWGVVAALAAIGLSACVPPTIPFNGVPAVPIRVATRPATPYLTTGKGCLKVLVIGDSMAHQLGNGLEAAFAATGRCARVTNRAVAGTAVIDWAPGASRDPAAVYDALRPDFVVVHFIGNESPYIRLRWTDPSWLPLTTSAALEIADVAIGRGLPLYWALPPKSASACDWSHPSASAFVAWASWIRDTLWTTRPVKPIDLRTPFGGETFSRWFSFPDGTVRALRQSDCVHFATDGEAIASELTVAAAFGEWGAVSPTLDEPGTLATTTTTSTAPPGEEGSTTTTTSTSAPETTPEG